MFKNIILSFLLLILFTCDYGLDDGRDLPGEWMENSIGYNQEDGILFNFNKNNSGDFQYGLNGTVMNCGSADFKWDVKNSKPYKIVRIYDINYGFCYNCKDLINSDTKYEYYFSLDKVYLYMKETGTNNWRTWKKQ